MTIVRDKIQDCLSQTKHNIVLLLQRDSRQATEWGKILEAIHTLLEKPEVQQHIQ